MCAFGINWSIHFGRRLRPGMNHLNSLKWRYEQVSNSPLVVVRIHTQIDILEILPGH